LVQLVSSLSSAVLPERLFQIPLAILLTGTVVLAVGLGLYAKAKGRHRAFSVAALASVLGLVLVALLEDRSAPTSDAETRAGRRFAQQAATASWAAPLIASLVHQVLSPSISQSRDALYISACAEGLLVVIGFVMGIVALLSVRKHGRQGILWPAAIGTGINTVILLAAACGILSEIGPLLPPKPATRMSLHWTAPDAEACVRFARRIEGAIKAGDSKLMSERLDLDVLTDRMFGGRGFSRQTLNAARRGVESSLLSPQGVVGQLIAACQRGMTYTFIRTHEVDGQMRALFRLLGDVGLNYHDMVLILRDGEIRIADIYVFASGEFLTDTCRRASLPLLAHGDKVAVAKLLTAESDYVKSLPTVEQLGASVAEGNDEQALAIYKQLPASVQKDKTIMLVRLKAAAAMGPDSSEYQRALDEMKELIPNDPCLHLLLGDYYVAAREFAKAHACIQALREATGGDDYLDALDAHITSFEGSSP
jgi:MFS family permease